MNIHEYQAKELLAKFGVAVPKGIAAMSVEEAVEAAKQLPGPLYVVKAQIHAGGRGKGKFKELGPDAKGGVRLAKSLDEVRAHATDMLGNTLVTIQTGDAGKQVQRLYITDGVDIGKEFYLALLVDRASSRIAIVASTEGGMDIEEVARTNPELIHTVIVENNEGLYPYECRKVGFQMGLTSKQTNQLTGIMLALHKMFVENDLSLVEVNPLIIDGNDNIVALDAKIAIDDNALFRHKDYSEWRDLKEENPVEVEARELGLNYVDLDGNVGCMVNGAGLAMATMDLIKQSGGDPANFLDVGGTADAKRVESAFRLILKDPNVKAILVNIFGGIVRCDRVAQGIVDAYNNLEDINVPIIVRLQGTNAKIAKEIIDSCDFKVYSATEFQEAADKIQEVLA